jgi:hypothetical protein
MKTPKTHYLVQFASRYAGARFKTLDAGSALWRAESLVDDTADLLELKDDAEAKDIRFGQRLGTYEIVQYFAVGFVTCLEWHAKSRLVDTMIFHPNCIELGDLKGIATLALSQMVAEGATIPHLLGAATRVSSVQEYLSIFKRVFGELKIVGDLEDVFRNRKTTVELPRLDADTSLYGVLDDLFASRNHLVHEIDLSVIGHFSLRDMWELPRAKKYGEAVVSCIKIVESYITEHAPKNFPNRLDSQGIAEDEYNKLLEEISTTEKQITPEIERWGTVDMSESTWTETLALSRASRAAELLFLSQASFLRPVRHLDSRREAQIEYLKNRLAFLSLLKSELEL